MGIIKHKCLPYIFILLTVTDVNYTYAFIQVHTKQTSVSPTNSYTENI